MTIKKMDRSGGYRYVVYDNDGKVLIITSNKNALKTTYYSLMSHKKENSRTTKCGQRALVL